MSSQTYFSTDIFYFFSPISHIFVEYIFYGRWNIKLINDDAGLMCKVQLFISLLKNLKRLGKKKNMIMFVIIAGIINVSAKGG